MASFSTSSSPKASSINRANTIRNDNKTGYIVSLVLSLKLNDANRSSIAHEILYFAFASSSSSSVSVIDKTT